MKLHLQKDYCNFPMSAQREVKPWNALPEDVMAPSVKVFESRLDKFWNNQPMKFNHKEELCVNDLDIEDSVLHPVNPMMMMMNGFTKDFFEMENRWALSLTSYHTFVTQSFKFRPFVGPEKSCNVNNVLTTRPRPRVQGQGQRQQQAKV